LIILYYIYISGLLVLYVIQLFYSLKVFKLYHNNNKGNHLCSFHFIIFVGLNAKKTTTTTTKIEIKRERKKIKI
jgi:hypothetical protein